MSVKTISIILITIITGISTANGYLVSTDEMLWNEFTDLELVAGSDMTMEAETVCVIQRNLIHLDISCTFVIKASNGGIETFRISLPEKVPMVGNPIMEEFEKSFKVYVDGEEVRFIIEPQSNYKSLGLYNYETYLKERGEDDTLVYSAWLKTKPSDTEISQLASSRDEEKRKELREKVRVFINNPNGYFGNITWKAEWKSNQTRIMNLKYVIKWKSNLRNQYELEKAKSVTIGLFWKNKINKADFSITLCEPPKRNFNEFLYESYLRETYPENAKWLSDRQVVWHFENWEPDRKRKIGVRIDVIDRRQQFVSYTACIFLGIPSLIYYTLYNWWTKRN